MLENPLQVPSRNKCTHKIKIRSDTFLIWHFTIHRELIHVDDVYDEIRDKEKMRQAEAQEQALRQKHNEEVIQEAEDIINRFKLVEEM